MHPDGGIRMPTALIQRIVGRKLEIIGITLMQMDICRQAGFPQVQTGIISIRPAVW